MIDGNAGCFLFLGNEPFLYFSLSFSTTSKWVPEKPTSPYIIDWHSMDSSFFLSDIFSKEGLSLHGGPI